MRKAADMPYHMGFQVKIYPSHEQKHIIAVNCGAARAVYNHLVACSNERYRLSKTAALVPAYRRRLDYLDSVTGELRNIKNALPYLCEKSVDEQAIANAIRNYRTAWKNQKERHTGVPVFKKRKYEQSYQTNAHYYQNKNKEITSNVRFEGDHHVTLPKLGRIRIGASRKQLRRFRDRLCDTRIGSICISVDAVGEYWASFSFASEEPFVTPSAPTGSQIGIDLNLLELYNDSEGCNIENKRYYRQSLRKLQKAQRKLSRRLERAKKEGRSLRESKNYQKQRRKAAFLHRKIRRQRESYLHNISSQTVKNHDFIAMEDLKVKNMMKNHHLSQAIADASWGTLRTMIRYKADLHQKTFVLVPPRFTSQTCSHCGYVLNRKERLSLSVREWECPSCHQKHQRDTNAANVILQRGLQIVSTV